MSNTLINNLAINNGWEIKPTAKSDTARLDSSAFAGECKEEVIQIAIKVEKFPNSATGHSNTCTIQMAIVKYSSC